MWQERRESGGSWKKELRWKTSDGCAVGERRAGPEIENWPLAALDQQTDSDAQQRTGTENKSCKFQPSRGRWPVLFYTTAKIVSFLQPTASFLRSAIAAQELVKAIVPARLPRNVHERTPTSASSSPDACTLLAAIQTSASQQSLSVSSPRSQAAPAFLISICRRTGVAAALSAESAETKLELAADGTVGALVNAAAHAPSLPRVSQW